MADLNKSIESDARRRKADASRYSPDFATYTWPVRARLQPAGVLVPAGIEWNGQLHSW